MPTINKKGKLHYKSVNGDDYIIYPSTEGKLVTMSDGTNVETAIDNLKRLTTGAKFEIIESDWELDSETALYQATLFHNLNIELEGFSISFYNNNESVNLDYVIVDKNNMIIYSDEIFNLTVSIKQSVEISIDLPKPVLDRIEKNEKDITSAKEDIGMKAEAIHNHTVSEITDLVIPEVDLSGYYNKTEVDEKVANVNIDLSNYYDKAEVDDKVSNVTVDLSNYYDKTEVDDKIATIDTDYILPVAGANVLGGVKVGANLSIDDNGILNAEATSVDLTDYYNKTEVDKKLDSKGFITDWGYTDSVNTESNEEEFNNYKYYHAGICIGGGSIWYVAGTKNARHLKRYVIATGELLNCPDSNSTIGQRTQAAYFDGKVWSYRGTIYPGYNPDSHFNIQYYDVASSEWSIVSAAPNQHGDLVADENNIYIIGSTKVQRLKKDYSEWEVVAEVRQTGYGTPWYLLYKGDLYWFYDRYDCKFKKTDLTTGITTDMPNMPAGMDSYSSQACIAGSKMYMITNRAHHINADKFGFYTFDFDTNEWSKDINGTTSRCGDFFGYYMGKLYLCYDEKNVSMTPIGTIRNKRINVSNTRSNNNDIKFFKGIDGQLVVNKDTNRLHLMDGINNGGIIIPNMNDVNGTGTPEVDLSDYYNKTEVDEKIAGVNNYTLPIASAETLGGIKVGANLTIDENGVLNAAASGGSTGGDGSSCPSNFNDFIVYDVSSIGLKFPKNYNNGPYVIYYYPDLNRTIFCENPKVAYNGSIGGMCGNAEGKNLNFSSITLRQSDYNFSAQDHPREQHYASTEEAKKILTDRNCTNVTLIGQNTLPFEQQIAGSNKNDIKQYIGKPKQLVVNTDDFTLHVMDGVTKGGHKVNTDMDAIPVIDDTSMSANKIWSSLKAYDIDSLETIIAPPAPMAKPSLNNVLETIKNYGMFSQLRSDSAFNLANLHLKAENNYEGKENAVYVAIFTEDKILIDKNNFESIFTRYELTTTIVDDREAWTFRPTTNSSNLFSHQKPFAMFTEVHTKERSSSYHNHAGGQIYFRYRGKDGSNSAVSHAVSVNETKANNMKPTSMASVQNAVEYTELTYGYTHDSSFLKDSFRAYEVNPKYVYKIELPSAFHRSKDGETYDEIIGDKFYKRVNDDGIAKTVEEVYTIEIPNMTVPAGEVTISTFTEDPAFTGHRKATYNASHFEIVEENLAGPPVVRYAKGNIAYNIDKLNKRIEEVAGAESSYTLPIASSTVLGGFKVGANLSIDSNGVLSATGGGGSTGGDNNGGGLGRLAVVDGVTGNEANGFAAISKGEVPFIFSKIDDKYYRVGMGNFVPNLDGGPVAPPINPPIMPPPGIDPDMSIYLNEIRIKRLIVGGIGDEHNYKLWISEVQATDFKGNKDVFTKTITGEDGAIVGFEEQAFDDINSGNNGACIFKNGGTTPEMLYGGIPLKNGGEHLNEIKIAFGTAISDLEHVPTNVVVYAETYTNSYVKILEVAAPSRQGFYTIDTTKIFVKEDTDLLGTKNFDGINLKIAERTDGTGITHTKDSRHPEGFENGLVFRGKEGATTTAKFNIEIKQPSILTMHFAVESEHGSDNATFFINNQNVFEGSGSYKSHKQIMDVEVGTVNVEFRYKKDHSVDNGLDGAVFWGYTLEAVKDVAARKRYLELKEKQDKLIDVLTKMVEVTIIPDGDNANPLLEELLKLKLDI